jgi:hypothetical protein
MCVADGGSRTNAPGRHHEEEFGMKISLEIRQVYIGCEMHVKQIAKRIMAHSTVSRHGICLSSNR